MVKVVATGDLRVESITIDPDAVDPEDVEMLQDMVLAARQRGAALRRGARRRCRWASRSTRRRSAGPGGGLGGLRPARRSRAAP